ncbi:hypothetical protein ACHAXR_011577 [Thalassiosira sp. AJA248-18]
MAHLSGSILPAWISAILLLTVVPVGALSPSSSSPTKLLRVCHSPACKDDGALSTIECLNAVAPPGVEVIKGGCVSLCGAGPVVECSHFFCSVMEVCSNEDDAASLKKKRVKGSESILALLDECTAFEGDGNEPALKPYMRDRLMNGYELSIEANAAYNAKKYQLAVDLYTDAIESGRKPAMILQEARSAFNILSNANEESDGYPVGMHWLVKSFKNSCRSRLFLKDVDGARRDAFASTVFSKNLNADAHECLAEVCAASSDALGELQALKAAVLQYGRMEEEYSQPLPGADAPARAEAAKKRSHASARKRVLGFRVAKLERDLGGS